MGQLRSSCCFQPPLSNHCSWGGGINSLGCINFRPDFQNLHLTNESQKVVQLSREQKYVTLFLSRTFCSSSSTAGRAALYADFTRAAAAAAEAEEKPTRFSAAVHWITLNSSHISEMITIAGMSYSQICAGSSSGLEVGSRYKAETPPLQREISIFSYFLNDTLGRDN